MKTSPVVKTVTALALAGALGVGIAVDTNPIALAATSKSGATVTKISVENVSGGSVTLNEGGIKYLSLKTVMKKNGKRVVKWDKFGKVKLKSSNPQVASIDKGGLLCANGEGSATITIRSKTKPSVKTSFVVNVKKNYGNLSALTDNFAANSSSLLLANEEGNSCYSPLSAYMALGMVALGANDTTSAATQSQVLNVLGASSTDELASNCRTLMDSLPFEPDADSSSSEDSIVRTYSDSTNTGSLKIANSIWSGDRFDFTDAFRETVSSTFDGKAKKINFLTESDKITQWISKKTNGLLAPTFNFDKDTIAALVNTVYFKDGWTETFNKKQNKDADFTRADGTTVTATFMHDTVKQNYAVTSTYTAASRSLGSGATMTFYLPVKGVEATDLIATPQDTDALLNTFSSARSDSVTTKRAYVNWSLPKFSFESTYNLNGVLSGLGMTDAFDEDVTGDFANMLTATSPTEEGDPYISTVQQGTKIAVAETGVEAAAYTAVIMCATSAYEEPVYYDFTLDRPFVYSITAKDGTVLFMGVVQDPTAE